MNDVRPILARLSNVLDGSFADGLSFSVKALDFLSLYRKGQHFVRQLVQCILL